MIKVGEKSYQPEEIISYYNGIFLDQVHQLKDKLFRMIALLLLVPETAQDNQKKDPKKIEYQPFLTKNEVKLKEIFALFYSFEFFCSSNTIHF